MNDATPVAADGSPGAARPALRRLSARLDAALAAQSARHALPRAAAALEAAGRRPRFAGAIDAAFPAADVRRLDLGADGVWTVETGALSLFGPQGPMPEPLAEALLDATRAGDRGPRAFFDLFHDRLIRALLDAIRLERPPLAGPPERTAQAEVLRALVGRLGPGAPDATDRALMGLAGLMRQRPQSLHALERLLTVRLGAPARARGLVGGWTPLPAAARARLGAGGPPLGRGATLGARAWTQEAGVAVELGPLDGARFHAFLPGGPQHATLAALVDAALPSELDAGCRLIVAADAAPRARLGPRTRLGWTSWLGAAPLASDGAVALRLARAGGGFPA